MKKIIIIVVADKNSPRYGKLAVHVEENGMESETWYPDPPRKSALADTLLTELTARSGEFKDPLVSRTMVDLRIVRHET